MGWNGPHVTDDGWLDYAACRNHPVLGPDAWFEVVNGRPQGQGAQALIVCRHVCPVMQQCRERYHGVEAIAGGGWFDRLGHFKNPVDALLDVDQAAAYLGIDVVRVRRMMGHRLPVAIHRNGKSWFRFEEVVRIAKIYDPPHGTLRRYKLHELRGEPVCLDCRMTVDVNLSACAS